mmetsp:Transcript_28297/g.60318  ORF Transcript_28297/g.60318 Transcript_28297/m.60318 type:complete len:446 (-) Transcript_28297:245-1582(-)
MVRHHVKKKKNSTTSNLSKKEQKKEQIEEDLENLDRFAGSSDEEDGSDDGVDDASDEDDGAQHETGAPGEKENSDSENSEDDYDDVYQENMAKGKAEPKQTKKPVKQKEDVDSEESEEDGSSEDDYNDEDQSDDDEDTTPSPRNAKTAGMANAMSRILGGQSMMFQDPSSGDANSVTSASKADAKPVILSKTTTPLQRLQQKIKTEEQALRQKRHNRRAENLSAMRLPLAPTAGMSAERLWKQKKKKIKRKRGSTDEEEQEVYRNDNALAIANEIEGERAHRRIATRGVVALFNAISKHRAVVAAEVTAKEDEKRRIREEGRASRFKRMNKDEDVDVRSKTKHGFLDMIKKSAVSGSQGNVNDSGARANGADESKENGTTKGAGSKSSGWSALKDDFMMNSKLKDWDKDISDDDDDEPKPQPDAKAEADGDKKKSRVKRQKVWVE